MVTCCWFVVSGFIAIIVWFRLCSFMFDCVCVGCDYVTLIVFTFVGLAGCLRVLVWVGLVADLL